MSSWDVKNHFFMHISLLDPFLSNFEKIKNFRFFQNFDLCLSNFFGPKITVLGAKMHKKYKKFFLTHKLFPNKNGAVNST